MRVMLQLMKKCSFRLIYSFNKCSYTSNKIRVIDGKCVFPKKLNQCFYVDLDRGHLVS